MRKLFLLGAVFAAGLMAQEASRAQEAKRNVQRIYEVKNVDVKQLGEMLMNNELQVRWNEYFKTISLYGPPEAVAAAEELIKRFDLKRFEATPRTREDRRNVEVTFYILIAAPKGTAGEAVPTDLEPAIKQLKSTFGYNDFRLLDSGFVRAREGSSVTTSGNTSAPNSDLPGLQGHYEFLVQRGVRVFVDDKGPRIRFDGLVFSLALPVTAGQVTKVGFNTDFEVREGQKVVVGKSKGDASAGAYILVLSARTVD